MLEVNFMEGDVGGKTGFCPGVSGFCPVLSCSVPDFVTVCPGFCPDVARFKEGNMANGFSTDR
jgi:hypothetical protein